MIGRILSNLYQLEEKIGSGGMADVYKATQLMAPQRTVAVKVLKPEYESDATFVRRFAQEAEAVLVLSHDNIVRSYDVGISEGMHYIVLEYVEGHTLKERIQEQGRLSTRALVAIGAQVLDALSHAHERGIVHRDVKPQNIIVNSRSRAKLADFGIARQTASENTQTFIGGSVLGSVHYLSPEQAMGETVTLKSDIYSMGVTLYEMATGQVPFSGETSVSVAIKHLHEAPPPPISLNPSIPPALNDIIVKAMQKDPKQRYQCARDMRTDLLRVLREPSGTFARLTDVPPKTASKRKPGIGVMRIAMAALVMISLFVVLLLMDQTRTPATSLLVPTLEGKTVEEAKNTASLRGYAAEVIETVVTDQYDSGIVLSQTPIAGSELKPGGVIQIVVSAGLPTCIAPNLLGMTLSEATEALTAAGLQRGDIEYRLADYPVGTIFRQDPVAQASLLEGDEVNIVICGEPSRSIEAPNVTELALVDALALLKDRGFTAFRVALTAAADTQVAIGHVVLQTPAQGEPFINTDPFTLTVASSLEYTANLSIPLDVPEDDAAFMATLLREENGIPYEQIVHTATLAQGEQELSLLPESNAGGEFQMLLYLNGSQVRQIPVIFSFRE